MPYCQLLNQSRLPDPNTCHKHLNLCNIVNGIHVYPNLPLVSYSPQHMLQNTHSYMQFSAHTNYFQHYFFPYETPYLVILLLHQLFLFLRIIFISYSFFMYHILYSHYSCVFPLCIKFHSYTPSGKKKVLNVEKDHKTACVCPMRNSYQMTSLPGN